MESKQTEKNKDDQILWRIVLVILSLYLLSLLFTDAFWGFHFLALAPGFITVLTIALMGGILLFRNNKSTLEKFIHWKMESKAKAGVLALIFGLLFYNFTFVNDSYGDALRHKAFLPEIVEELDEARTSQAYNLNVFQPKIGEITVLNAVELISYHTETKVTDVFRWIGTFFGVIFIFCWSLFTDRYFENSKLKNTLLVMGILSPFLQLFFGHIEIYAPAVTMSTVTMMCLLLFIKERKKVWGFLMLLCLFLSLKFHFVCVLMIPACGIGWMHYWNPKPVARLTTWKNIGYFVMIPLVLMGILAYIFVFKDHTDPRFLNGSIDTSERIFLPFFSPEAPLDRYNLFSWSHIWDYFNVFFLWSVSGIFILIVAVFRRRTIDWGNSALIILGMTLLFYVGLFFMVNPLLSMPMDWDLFSLPAPILLLFSSVLLSQFKSESLQEKLIPFLLMFSMLTIPIIATNNSIESTSQRLESLGRYTFGNYWIRSVGTLHAGLQMDAENYEKRLLYNVRNLRGSALKGKDQEYANLLWRTGQYYRKNGNPGEGLKWHLESRNYADLNYNLVGIVESYYLLEDYPNALKESELLVQRQHPSEERALEIAFDCALKANDSTSIMVFGVRLQQLFPDDSYYTETMQSFRDNYNRTRN